MRRRDLLSASVAAALVAPRARGQPIPTVRIGVLTDLSGAYAADAGAGSIACARQAAQEFAATGPPFAIDIISADHGNDAAKGAAIAAHWCDTGGVDLILDVPDSDVALAVSRVAREKNRVFIDCGAGSTALTGTACSPYTIHWSFDTTMLARSTGGAFTQAGGSTWFFITAGYQFGQQMEAETARYVISAGGRIEGSAVYRFPGTTDFIPLLRQAQESGAAVLGLANAGADVTACVRGVGSLGLSGQMRIACLLMQLTDVHALGLETAGGMLLTESFYWDLNDRTRAFTARLMARQKPPAYPNMIQAGCYAGTLHFLRAVAAMGVAKARSDPAALVARMKATPTDDDAFGHGSIRADGRAMFPAFLFCVKTPDESSAPWDYYRLVSTTSAEDAAPARLAGGCPMAKP